MTVAGDIVIQEVARPTRSSLRYSTVRRRRRHTSVYGRGPGAYAPPLSPPRPGSVGRARPGAPAGQRRWTDRPTADRDLRERGNERPNREYLFILYCCCCCCCFPLLLVVCRTRAVICIRELENAVKRCSILSHGAALILPLRPENIYFVD